MSVMLYALIIPLIMKKYKDFLKIPEDGSNLEFRTSSDTIIARKYERVVIGQRGPYVEFTSNQILCNKLFIPKSQLFRLSDPKIYYIEFRTNDDSNVKVYYQMRTVAYADYKIGYFYVSPSDLYTNSIRCLTSLEDLCKASEEFFDFKF
jgi:hypothetical protein